MVIPDNPNGLQKWIGLAMSRFNQSGKSYKTVKEKFSSEKVIKKYYSLINQ